VPMSFWALMLIPLENTAIGISTNNPLKETISWVSAFVAINNYKQPIAIPSSTKNRQLQAVRREFGCCRLIVQPKLAAGAALQSNTAELEPTHDLSIRIGSGVRVMGNWKVVSTSGQQMILEQGLVRKELSCPRNRIGSRIFKTASTGQHFEDTTISLLLTDYKV
jgi:hypothetical protein